LSTPLDGLPELQLALYSIIDYGSGERLIGSAEIALVSNDLKERGTQTDSDTLAVVCIGSPLS
jgi:hypothetical protein